MTPSLPTLEIDDELFRRFSDVPPIVILDVALATAAAVIWEEHLPEPAMLLDPNHLPEPACMTSHMVVTCIGELRHLLRLHLAEMKRALPPSQDDHLF